MTHAAEVYRGADRRGQGNRRQRGYPQAQAPAPRRLRSRVLPPARGRKLPPGVGDSQAAAGIPHQVRPWCARVCCAAGDRCQCLLASEGEQPGPEPIGIRQHRVAGGQVSGSGRHVGLVRLGWRFPSAAFYLRGGEQRRRLVSGQAQNRTEILAVNAMPVDELDDFGAVW